MSTIQFSGLASGIDSAALIDALVEAREAQNISRRAEIEHLESENDSLAELNTKILALSDLVDAFRTANGGGVNKKATSSSATVATATSGSGAINGSYDLTVTATASTATGSIQNTDSGSGHDFDDLDDVFDPDGTGTESLTVTVGTGTDQVVISVANAGGMTVQEVIDAINNDSNATGRVSASAVNVGTSSNPTYEIVVNTLKSGLNEGQLGIAYSGASGDIAIDDSNGQATDAVFSISGIQGNITRSSNSVSDVLPGVTFNLLGAGNTTITIGNDGDATADSVQEIVTAFNDIVEFVAENDLVTRVDDQDGAANVFGSLAKTDVDNDFIKTFRDLLVGAESTNGTAVTAFAEMGLSTNRDGTLTFDIDEFKDSVSSDATGVAEVLTSFADSAAGISGSFYQFTKLNGFIDTAKESNDNEIENLNDKIAQVERSTAKLRENLEGQFTRLEVLTSKLQSTQSALSGLLAGL